MSEPMYLQGDSIALGTDIDHDDEPDIWDAADDAYELMMEK